MQTDHPQIISRSAVAFLSGTSLSRVTGMCRDMAMAFCFGSHPVVAAFMVAFRFSNLFRRLFGEGQMPAGFVPYFESSRKEFPERGARFFRDLFHSMAIFLIVLILMAEILLYVCWKLGGLSVDNKEIIFLTMLMMPGVLFACLFGISSALLQCEKKYFLSGFAPVAFNLVWIATVFACRNSKPEEAAVSLSVAIIVALALQWCTTLPSTLGYLRQHLSWKELWKPRLFSQEISALCKPLAIGMMGVGAVQINSALDALFARYASLEGPAYLWYAIRMQQLPLALFGIALSSALLPPLARAAAENGMQKYKELLQFALHRNFLWIFPCVVAIFVLGSASVNLLYGRGDFSQEATRETLLCLWGYGVGLFPASVVLLLAPAFYAKKDFRTPMLGSLYSVMLNIGLNALFVFGYGWGAFSVALATSAAAVFNCHFLVRGLFSEIGTIFSWSFFRPLAKIAACVLLAGAATIWLGHFLVNDPTWDLLLGKSPSFVRASLEQVLHFFVLTGTFGVLLFSYSWMLGANRFEV